MYHINKKQRRLPSWWQWIIIVIILASSGTGGGLYYAKYRHKVGLKIMRRATAPVSIKPKPTPKPITYDAVESGVLPWNLNSSLSRLTAYPGASLHQIIFAGGVNGSGVSKAGIYSLNFENGSQSLIGNLPVATHDAAGAKIGSQYFVFGGGVSSSYDSVVGFMQSGSGGSQSVMPEKRSDSTAITLNGTTYIIGGYNGSMPDATVLNTSDGTHFSDFGKLPVPVRYPAVASSNGLIYIFGGDANGKPADIVQILDPSSHKISLAPWHLTVPVEGAMAFTIGQEMFLAGGQSSEPQSIPTGVGTTQISGVPVSGKSLTQNTIWAVDAPEGKLLKAGILQLPVSNAGVAVLGNRAWIIGGEYNGQAVSNVQMVTPNVEFGIAGTPGAGSPYYGDKLMIADRGNNRLLIMNSSMEVTWRYPSINTPVNISQGFYFPDDAFFVNHGTGIISNQEENETVIQMAYPSGKVTWSFGHPRQSGWADGYLKMPDDAYLLKNGVVLVADDDNCRVLLISPAGKVIGQIGETGVCRHNPGISLGSPNGDTPLFNGNVLISEIDGSWVSEYTPSGKNVWTAHLPIAYPSDPQQLGASAGKNPNNYLIADFSSPGAFLRFNRSGQVLYEYSPSYGQGRLDHPSLVEQLPSGVYMANDDYRNRMVAIDPNTNALVWQYGINDQAGKTTGMLQTPDGFDILTADGSTPTHSMTK